MDEIIFSGDSTPSPLEPSEYLEFFEGGPPGPPGVGTDAQAAAYVADPTSQTHTAIETLIAVEAALRAAADAALSSELTTETALRAAADALLIPLAQRGSPNGVATLDLSGKIPPSQIPALIIGNVYVETSQAAMLALSAAVGDICRRTDINETFILQSLPASTLSHWLQITTPGTVTSVATRTGDVTLSVADISGLGTAATHAATDFDAAGAAAAAQTAAESFASSAATTAQTNAEAFATSGLNTESSARSAADATLTTNLAAEVTRAEAAEATQASNLTTETNARIAGDAATLTSAETFAESYADTNKLDKAANLSDLSNVPSARTHLGLGTAATQDKVAAGSAGVLDATDPALTDSRHPSGSAGGDLTGSYPNPTLVHVGTPGTYGDISHPVTITTDAEGRVTAAAQTSRWNIRAVTANTVAADGDYIQANATSGNVQITIPVTAAASVVVERMDSSANSVTVVCSGTIDGDPSATLISAYTSVTFLGDGTNCAVVSASTNQAPVISAASPITYNPSTHTVGLNPAAVTVTTQSPLDNSTKAASTAYADAAVAVEKSRAQAFEATLPATYASFIGLAKVPDQIITGSITRNANEVVTSAAVVWPDGTTGTFTADTIGALNTIDAYHITYGSPTVIHTYTQPTITRDATGAATTVPAIVVT